MIKSITYFFSSGRKATIKTLKRHENLETFMKDNNIINLANGYAQRIKKFNYQGAWGWSKERPMACTFNHVNEDGTKFVETFNMSTLTNISSL